MGDSYPHVRLAAVQAAPIYLDREASAEKACQLIANAAAEGAQVIVFPEGFIPGHPLWFHFLPATGTRSRELSTRLFKNSVELPGAIVAGPMGPDEGILYADADLEECVHEKVVHDFAGHYNRPDVFRLLVSRSAPEIMTRVESALDPGQPPRETSERRPSSSGGDDLRRLLSATPPSPER